MRLIIPQKTKKGIGKMDFFQYTVPIHGQPVSRFCLDVLARERQVLITGQSCEAGTAPKATDRSAAGAADVRSTAGLWPAGAGP